MQSTLLWAFLRYFGMPGRARRVKLVWADTGVPLALLDVRQLCEEYPPHPFDANNARQPGPYSDKSAR